MQFIQHVRSIKVHEPELLLKLTHNSGLNLVEVLQLTVRNEDDDGLAAAIKLELLSGINERAVQVSLELRGRRL